MGRIGRGWQMTKMSLGVIRKDKEILIFPVLSGLVTILILASFLGGMFVTSGLSVFEQGGSQWVLYVFLVAFYFVSFFVAIFFKSCIIGCATIRMNGGNPTVRDGLRIAGQNIRRILLWSLLAATVGLVIRSLQERSGVIGRIVMGILGIAWTIVTYFVVPVLIYENLGPWASVKRSASILKQTWGEALVGNLGMGIIFALLAIPGVLGLFVGVFGIIQWGIALGLIVLVTSVVYLLIIAIVNSAAEAVLVAALYRYATTGQASTEFAGFSFQQPFVAR